MRARKSLLCAAMVLLTSTSGVSLAVAGAGPVGGPAQAAPSGPTTPACGGVQPTKADGSPWVCTFSDEFSGKSLAPAKWRAQTTAFSGWTTADTCYVDTSRNIAVRDGLLRLTARTESRPLSCSTGSSSWSTRHTGGAVMTWNRFAQAYGRFEFRAKYPATREAGFWSNLWLYPQELTYGRWPHSGEIDVAEHWSGHGDKVFPSLHYSGRTSADTAWSCTVADATQFHTYRLEWTPEVMRFYYDDALCFERAWTPSAPLVAPQPFDKRFFLVLSNGYGDTTYPISQSLPGQGEMAVDWVRVYR
ncbi:beta-glucanase (GH16 family) [Nocardioides thalensis]|uniref:Beta-glucanase (GH16 family) n=1 Tax=Nocardioides thalensis TaxID=1914755 RepID=A0A853C5Q0_9ACTN|nr:glycoside hydrolase family 16 protein [Nocardioides thalensis]NYJ02804.1 beta-glucanase (GH16 family) [Nocardioides thalensis]